MAKRETTKKQVIDQLTEELCGSILKLSIGSKTSIAKLVSRYYTEQGYEFQYIGPEYGYVWTKDSGETFAIRDGDLFSVLDRVTKKLKGKRKLDFREYDDMAVGLPYNLIFTIREN
jgi:hypothetical protein